MIKFPLKISVAPLANSEEQWSDDSDSGRDEEWRVLRWHALGNRRVHEHEPRGCDCDCLVGSDVFQAPQVLHQRKQRQSNAVATRHY